MQSLPRRTRASRTSGCDWPKATPQVLVGGPQQKSPPRRSAPCSAASALRLPFQGPSYRILRACLQIPLRSPTASCARVYAACPPLQPLATVGTLRDLKPLQRHRAKRVDRHVGARLRLAPGRASAVKRTKSVPAGLDKARPIIVESILRNPYVACRLGGCDLTLQHSQHSLNSRVPIHGRGDRQTLRGCLCRPP